MDTFAQAVYDQLNIDDLLSEFGSSVLPFESILLGYKQTPVFADGAVLSGNEITDIVRKAQGPVDGFLVGQGGGVGIWPGHTNVACDTAISAAGSPIWSISPGTLSVDSTRTDNPFPGHNWMKVVNSATGANLYPDPTRWYPAVPGQGWCASAWVVGPPGLVVQLTINGLNASGTTLDILGKNITCTGVPQRVNLQLLLSNAATAKVTFTLSSSAPNTVWWFTAPMLASTSASGGQLEDLPYIANTSTTALSTATRNNGRVQIPTSFLSQKQGWIAARVMVSYTPAQLTQNLDIFNWTTGNNEALSAFLNPTANGYIFGSNMTAPAVATYASIPLVTPWVPWVPMTVIFAWDSTTIYLSYNGSPFVASVPANRVTPNNPFFDIGSYSNAAAVLAGNVQWFLCGSGTPSSSDIAAINSMGSAVPNPTPATLFGYFISALGSMFQQMDDLAQTGIGTDGKQANSWTKLLDIDRVPDEGLSWFSQFVGVQLDPNLSLNDQRQQIRNHVGWNRGTPAAIAAAVKPLLTGSQTVRFVERDTSPYHFNIATYTAETSAGAATAIPGIVTAVKPAGLQFTYTDIAGSPTTSLTYSQLFFDYTTNQLLVNSNQAYQNVYMTP